MKQNIKTSVGVAIIAIFAFTAGMLVFKYLAIMM
jgi:hypothetical protein